MHTEKTCPICQQPYTPKSPNQTYCSRACRDTAATKRIECTCQQCGIKFERTRGALAQRSGGTYCSAACFHLAHTEHMKEHPSNPRVERAMCTCEQCGKQFGLPPKRLQRTDMRQGRFCSRACHNAFKRTIRGEEHPLYKPATHVCEWCGQEYRTKAVFVRNATTRFCSRKCHGAYTTANFSDGHRTGIEATIHALLTGLGFAFEAQAPIGRFICDFVLPASKVAIECDGAYWHSLPVVIARDRRKDALLQVKGYAVVRLPESLIRSNLIECRSRILSALP